MSEPMRLAVRVAAPLKDVHHALTDPGTMRVWLAEHAEAELPRRYEFWGRYTPAGDVARQRLLHADDRTLRFVWRLEELDTTVEIALTEETRRDQESGQDRETGATVITLTQDGLPSFQELMAGAGGALSVIHTFWSAALAGLVDHLEGRTPLPMCDFTSPVMREQVVIDAEPGAVYDSIVDPAVFGRWFGAHVEIEPHVGGRFAMGGFENDPSPAKIVELEPGRALTLRWDDGSIAGWELEGSQGRTRLTFVQSGFDENDPPYDAWMGWLSGIAELRRFHEVPDWRAIWLDVQLEGMPEGMISY